MKKFLFLFLLSLSNIQGYTITQNSSLYLTSFEMQDQENYLGKVVFQRNLYLGPASYDLLDPNGFCEAKGFLEYSLNPFSINISAQGLNLTDWKGEKIGYIEFIQEPTTSLAEYYFYDNSNNLTCKAALNDSFELEIATLDNKTVACMKKQIDLAHAFWEMDVIDPTVLDRRVLQIFSAILIESEPQYKTVLSSDKTDKKASRSRISAHACAETRT